MAKKQTAGRDRLGKLAPKFAELNDDVLFGEVWSREAELSARDRSMITIAALFAICAARRPLVRLPAATRRSPTATFIKVFR